MADLPEFKFWFNTSDSEMGVRMGLGIYETETVDFYRRTITLGMTCWDIGSQTGFYTCLFAYLAGANGKVIAYEPMPESFEMINRNIAANEWGSRVIVNNVACSDSAGYLSMLPIAQMYMADNESPNAKKNKYVRLDQENNPFPDIIKIDVEGHEPAVIRGLSGILE